MELGTLDPTKVAKVSKMELDFDIPACKGETPDLNMVFLDILDFDPQERDNLEPMQPHRPEHEIPSNNAEEEPISQSDCTTSTNKGIAGDLSRVIASDPIPSTISGTGGGLTSSGLSVNGPEASYKGSSASEEEVELEVFTPPTPTMEELLKLRPRIKRVKKITPVPEEAKGGEYWAMREKNKIAARNCRSKKRSIDEGRVALLKETLEENKRLKVENQRLKQGETVTAKVHQDNIFLRTVCANLCSKINELGGRVQFPEGYELSNLDWIGLNLPH